MIITSEGKVREWTDFLQPSAGSWSPLTNVYSVCQFCELYGLPVATLLLAIFMAQSNNSYV